MTPDDLKNILAAHAQWLADPTTGQRANLTRAYLTRAYLTRADLTGAIIVPGWCLVRA